MLGAALTPSQFMVQKVSTIYYTPTRPGKEQHYPHDTLLCEWHLSSGGFCVCKISFLSLILEI